MSAIKLVLTESNWENELEDSALPDQTKRLLRLALYAKRTSKQYPKIDAPDFDRIITDEVWYIQMGRSGMILDRKSGRLVLTTGA